MYKLFRRRPLANGYRDLDTGVVTRVHAMQLSLGAGLTTAQREHIFNGSGPCLPEQLPVCEEALLDLYEAKLREIAAQIATLAEVQARLGERVRRLREHGR
jgi:hypothetical protein